VPCRFEAPGQALRQPAQRGDEDADDGEGEGDEASHEAASGADPDM
jgi:hypothetical protein